jgi:hypothetical protein
MPVISAPLTRLFTFLLLACAWAHAGELGRLVPPANSEAAVTPEKPKYLIFWHLPEKAGELVERVGMKGDVQTRLLGFGLFLQPFEFETQLPRLIRSAFSAAREHNLAVSPSRQRQNWIESSTI